MKTNELMIGDWIYRPDCYDRVTEIRDGYILGQDYLRGAIFEQELEPIKLSTDILLKNGYESHDEIGWLYYTSPDKRIIATPSNNANLNSDNEWVIHFDNEDMNSIGNVELTYVHELQHMFKLFNFETDFIV